MNPTRENGPRILIGASSFVDATAALHLLGHLIQAWRPSLGGILVEDTVSLSICALPNQRVVTASGTVALAPTISQIRTLIEADARAFKQSLARLADDAGAPWTFARDTGDLIQTGLHMATSWDILVFAHRQVHPAAGKVVLLEPSNPADSPMTEMSKLLSVQLGADRVILSVNGAGPSDTASGVPHVYRHATLDDALAQLARLNTRAVLVDLARGPVHTSEDLQRLIEVARCPVFVFGAMSAARLLEQTTQIPPAPNTGNKTGG